MTQEEGGRMIDMKADEHQWWKRDPGAVAPDKPRPGPHYVGVVLWGLISAVVWIVILGLVMLKW